MRLWAGALLLLSACTADSGSADQLPRHERYGILRDLVLFQRRYDDGGPFFLDRFETTRRDWRSWLEATHQPLLVSGEAEEGPAVGGPAEVRSRHPVTGVAMTTACGFARWRFCRLQRLDEWQHARTAGGRYPYPWGGTWGAGTWCNTRDLGLNRTTPAGSFAASSSGNGIFDLVGNVQEWTETVPVPPIRFSGEVGPPAWLYMPGEADLRGSFGVSAWLPAWHPAPTSWLVAATPTPTALPRLVVGGHYRSQIPASRRRKPQFPTVGWWRDRDRHSSLTKVVDPLPNPELLHPEAYGDLTGVRLATDPESLLAALLREPTAPTDLEAAMVRRFLRRPDHRQVLREAWPRARRGVAARGPLQALLAAELDR